MPPKTDFQTGPGPCLSGEDAFPCIEDVFSFKLARLVAITDRHLHHWTVSRVGLSLNEWRLLTAIASLAPAHAGAVADQLLMDKSQASRLIKALAAKHLILSRADPGDARAVVLRLSAKGRAVHRQTMADLCRRNAELVQGFTPEEIGMLDRMLDRLTARSMAMLTSETAPGLTEEAE